MRLLTTSPNGELALTKDRTPPASYAILSHTWGPDDDEVTFDDLQNKTGTNKTGYAKLWFCANQAKKDGLEYFWVDTCCINKANHVELSKAITSMFRWYREATKCYVYLSDVSVGDNSQPVMRHTWKTAFSTSQWFRRGWTLQELLAPASVEFFSVEGRLLGNKQTLEGLIHGITNIPVTALRGTSLSSFTVDERLQWTEGRDTKEPEDQAYCLLGIFGVFMPLMYGEGQNAYTRLREEIKRAADSTLSSSPTHWTVIRAPNPLFTGREDVLQELCSIIHNAVATPPHQGQRRVVVSGMGGQGKSEICLQLAYLFRPKFWGVFWIDISTVSLAEWLFLELARKLCLPAQSWEEACLGIANLQHPWLLVLDNADEPDVDYQLYIPNSPLGVVIVTSRNEECQQYATAKALSLDGLSDHAARELLLKAARVPVDRHGALQDDAARVAALLQSHPLALIQAGAYVARGHCRLDQYPTVYEKQRRRLLEFRPRQAQSRYRDVYATFEASAAALKQSTAATARDALQLLPLLAVGGASRLPLVMFKAGWEGAQTVPSDMVDDAADDKVELLTPWHISRLPSFLDVSADTWDSFRLVEAVQLLKAFALVTTDSSGDSMSVSMHPLILAWARDRQSAGEQHNSWLSMGCIVALTRKGETMTRAHDRQLQPHVESVTAWDKGAMFAGAPRKLVARVLRLNSWMGLDEMTVEARWLGMYDLASRNLVNCGKPRQAIHLLQQVVAVRKESLGPGCREHPDQLASQHTLAGAYEANGQVKEAVALLEEVVQIRVQSLAADHPSRLASQHTLAGAYRANGQVKEAVALLEEVVQIWAQSLAVDHPSRLASQHALAGAYKANGQVKEAVALLEEVVQIQAQSLAADHPSRLVSQHTLAGAYKANGQVKEAVALLEEVVQIQAQSLAADHPSRLASQHALAGAYEVNGQVKEAVALLEEVVQIQAQSLAADHPDRLTSQHTLAGAYRANGQVKEAVALLEEVVQIWAQSLAVDHPSRLASQHALAGAYKANGQVKEAVALLEEVVQIQAQSLAADHPSRLVSQHTLAGVYCVNGQVKEAVALLEEVVQIEAQSLAADHPSRLASQHALAGAYKANGQVKEAVALLEEVVQIKAQSLAADHPSRLASQHTLAGAYEANGQVKEAVALLEEVVQIEAQSLAVDHPSRLASQHVLAGAYKANGQVKEAVALLEEVVQIRAQSLAADHPSRLASQHNLAVYLWEVEERERAYYLMSQVVDHYKLKFDANHPARQTSEQWLQHFREEIELLEQ